MKPTLKPGIPFSEYVDLPGVNVSTLLNYADQTPEEGRWDELHPEGDKPCLVKGHATHAAVLEPKVFEEVYACQPNFGDGRTNAAKAAKVEWLKANGHKISLTEFEYDDTIGMSRRVLTDPITRDVFGGRGQNELTVLWTDERTGLDCKARIDRITEYHGYQLLVDLKTARSISDRAISNAMAEHHYNTRLAWYMDALNLIHPTEWRPMFVWVRSSSPYTIRMTEFESDDEEEGRQEYRALLDTYAACLKANHWPGYPEGIEIVKLPRWAFRFVQPKGIL